MFDNTEDPLNKKLFEQSVHSRQQIILDYLHDNDGEATFRELKQTLVAHSKDSLNETEREIETEDFRFYLENVDVPILEDLGIVRCNYRDNVLHLREGIDPHPFLNRKTSGNSLKWELSYGLIGFGLAGLILLHLYLSKPTSGMILSWAVTTAVILLVTIAILHHTDEGTF